MINAIFNFTNFWEGRANPHFNGVNNLGEGWQLSHGERSRLYIARALLQSTTVLSLDESFAALDPQTLSRV